VTEPVQTRAARAKRILIVDDEVSILRVLSDSLGSRGGVDEIVTATDGPSALAHLGRSPFDLVITDYRMTGMNGLELIDAIRSIQPRARVILMTAFGNDELQEEARRRQAYRYLVKPLTVNTFRQVVEEALADMAISRPGILILSDERYREALGLLESLKGSVGARCVFLADAAGHVIAHTGEIDGLSLEQIASLLGGGIATIGACGQSCGDEGESLNLAYHEGANHCLYATNVGERLLLITVIRNTPYASRIGSVWYYAQRAAASMRRTLGDGDFASPPPELAAAHEGELDRELDSLFPSTEEPPRPETAPEAAPAAPLMTYDQALQAGLLGGETSGGSGSGQP
jgi:CheY-like chemotaxis protein